MRKGKSFYETNQKPQPKTTRKSPGQICVSSEKQQTRQKTGQEPNTNTHTNKKDLPRTQWERAHCVCYKNMHRNSQTNYRHLHK